MFFRSDSIHQTSGNPPGSGRHGNPLPPWRWLALVVISIIMLAITACSNLSAPAASVDTAPTPTPAAVSTPTTGVALLDTVAPAATPTPLPATATPPPTATATSEPTATATAVPPAAATAATEASLPKVEPQLAAALQAVLDSTVADGYIPGAVVAVNIPGRQTWVGASGFADRGAQLPMTPETRMRIASISKVFTAVVVMQLVEEGRLSLDQPLATWYPDLLPNADTITVRMLLQQTSGLYDYLEDRSYANQAYQQPDRFFAPQELVGYAARFPLAFAPGSANNWDYSSTNYVILGMVIEAVTGKPLAVEMRERIFAPLNLDGTYFAPDEPIEGQFATGHARSAVQRDVAMSFAFATANLVSTVDDVQTFARALFAGDLVSAESREQMLSFVDGKGQYSMPDLGYGLGVMRNVLPVQRAPEQSTVYGHIGGFGGFRSAVWFAPQSEITIALGINQGSTNPNLLAEAVFQTVLEGLGS